MRTTRLLLTTTLGFALALVLATPAAAASRTASASTPVDASAGGSIDVQIWPGQGAGQTAVITVVEVDEKTELPATVRVPITPGTTVEWAGEIMGGGPSADIAQPFTLVQGRGGQFAVFTLTKSRHGQVDAIGFPLQTSGDSVVVGVEYVQSVASPLTSISVRVPPNVSKVKISPKPEGNPTANDSGEALYNLKPKSYKPGDKQPVAISYSTAPPVPPAPGSDLNGVLIGLGIALVVAVVATVVVVRRQASTVSAGEGYAGDAVADEAEVPAAADVDDPFDDDEPDLDFS